MATPTFSLPPPTAEEVASRLEEVARRQQEATPEPIFQKPNVTQSYDYLCELERDRFTSDEIDAFRMRIPESSYWEFEARHFNNELSELIWENILHEYCEDGIPTANAWRNVAMAYRRRLMRHGYSMQLVRESRFSIKEQRYWEPEAECLRGIAALREHEIQKKHWKGKANIQGIPSPAESDTRYGCLGKKPERKCKTPTKQPTRRSRRPQSKVGQPRPDGVSDGKGSVLRLSTTSKVGKRQGKGRR